MTMATIYPYHNKIEQIKKTSEKERKNKIENKGNLLQ
jgi:hypothetical protein